MTEPNKTTIDPLEENINARPATPSEAAYTEGYVKGRSTEKEAQREKDLMVRDNNNAARGLLLGFLLFSVVGLVVGTVLYVGRDRSSEPTVPALPSASPEAENRPDKEKETTIIERDRTIERTQEVVPVPQQPAPASPAPPPKVEVNVPAPNPDSNNQEPEAAQPPKDKETTIIEKTVEKTQEVVPIPAASPEPPKVEINLPDSSDKNPPASEEQPESQANPDSSNSSESQPIEPENKTNEPNTQPDASSETPSTTEPTDPSGNQSRQQESKTDVASAAKPDRSASQAKQDPANTAAVAGGGSEPTENEAGLADGTPTESESAPSNTASSSNGDAPTDSEPAPSEAASSSGGDASSEKAAGEGKLPSES